MAARPSRAPDPDAVAQTADLLQAARSRRVRHAINATGIILHTGLGRAVFPESVVDSILPELKGYGTLATDPAPGLRGRRDERIEPLLCELPGAEAVNGVNNAAATLPVLAAERARAAGNGPREAAGGC